mgnify:CR=1 FL=1
MRKCVNCGADIAEDTVFCGNCGTKVEPMDVIVSSPPKVESNMKSQEDSDNLLLERLLRQIEPKLDALLKLLRENLEKKEDDENRIVEINRYEDIIQRLQAENDELRKSLAEKRCPGCGNLITEEMNFCNVCGRKLTE